VGRIVALTNKQTDHDPPLGDGGREYRGRQLRYHLLRYRGKPSRVNKLGEIRTATQANWMNVVERCKRQSEISKRGQHVPYSRFWLILYFAVYATVNAHVPPVLATAVPQDVKSGVGRPDSEGTEGSLIAVERDIVGKKFGETVPRLNNYLKDHPDSWRAHYDLGYVLFRTHEFGPSIKELSKSLELNLKNAEAHKILGLDCSIIGRYDLAEVELLEALRLKPESAELHYFLARTYYTRGVYPLAKREFEATIRLDPSYMKAYSNLGITMEALGDTDTALRNYTMAIQLDERRKLNSEWPYIYLSAFYNRQKKPAEALGYAQKAIAINPRADTGYFEMAKAYRSQGEWHKAADASRSAIAINSQTADYYYVLGLMLRKLGRPQQSQEALDRYAELQKQSGESAHERLEHNPQEPVTAPEP
jgi:tetratricopeptide (TPR) repeat protein